MSRMQPPKNPKEAIISRRNPCYGFAVLADIQENKRLMSILIETRDAILAIVDPDRALKKSPIKSPLYIKQKFFHASVFCMPPLLDQVEFINLYANKNGLLNQQTMDNLCDVLQAHLEEEKPSLTPIKFEIMSDGTILARFSYNTKSQDDAPLLTLASTLDPDKKFSQWDPTNRLRYSTVAVVLCVIDTDTLSDKLTKLQEQLEIASQKLMDLGNIQIDPFHLISGYNKRTFSLKHFSMYAAIHSDHILKI